MVMLQPPLETLSSSPRTAAILAGGGSTRMGMDKALLPLPSGETVLERVLQVVSPVSERVIVVGREGPRNFPLPALTPGPSLGSGQGGHIQFLPDEMPGEGPAAALNTVLRYANCPVLLVACDMPGLTTESVEWLWHQAEGTAATEGVAGVSGEQWEPLFAVYFPACLPRLERLLSEGKRSLQALLRSGDFAAVTPPENLLPALRNVNTPEEWGAFLRTVS